jgi:cyanophycinase
MPKALLVPMLIATGLFAGSLGACSSNAGSPVSDAGATPDAALDAPADGADAAGLDAYRVGASDDAVTKTAPGLVLMGGGTDVDDAFRWMIGRSGGGDFLVLRASGTDAYDDYLYTQLGGLHSVETVIVHDRSEAESPALAAKIDRAEALFFAGGDQARYVALFEGTALAAHVRDLAARAPIGGTSAGLHVLGGRIYDARVGSVISAEALADPFDSRITFRDGFLLSPSFSALSGVVTDSHFYARDRMGRSLAFLARAYLEAPTPARVLAVDEATAVLVDVDATARVVGSGYAYFLRMASPPDACTQGAPLALKNVAVARVAGGSSDVVSMQSFAGAGLEYTLAVAGGTITSSRGKVY